MVDPPPAVTHQQLQSKALLALEEAVQECRYRTPRRSFALRFALAYLYATSQSDRHSFDELWKALGSAKSPWSFSVANNALLRVYRALNIDRDDEVEMEMWRRWSKEEGHGGRH